MREILFRGKRLDNGEWIDGMLFDGEHFAVIADKIMQSDWHPTIDNFLIFGKQVIPETVGQYTGLTDKNGKKIFEGDICWFYGGEYYSGCWEQNAIIAITDLTDDEQTHYLNNAEYCEIIGNIYDNPELLGGKENV